MGCLLLPLDQMFKSTGMSVRSQNLNKMRYYVLTVFVS